MLEMSDHVPIHPPRRSTRPREHEIQIRKKFTGFNLHVPGVRVQGRSAHAT